MTLSRRSRFVVLGLVLLVVGGFAVWQLVGFFSGAGLTPRQADAELADEILAGHARLQAAVRTGSGTLERWREEPLPAGDELPPLNTSQASLQESDFYLRDDSARLDRHPQSNSNQAEGVFLETPEHGYIAHYSPGMNGEVHQNSDAKWQIDILLREPLGAAYGGYRASVATLLNTPGITISRRPFEDIPDAVWLEGEFAETDSISSQMRIILDPRYDYAVRDIHTQLRGGPLQGDLRQRVQLTQLPDGSYVPHEVESINRLTDQPSGLTTEYRELVRVHLDSQEPPAEELFTLESLLALDPGNIVLVKEQTKAPLIPDDITAAFISALPGNQNGQPLTFAMVIVTVGLLLAVCWLTYQRFKRRRPAAQS